MAALDPANLTWSRGPSLPEPHAYGTASVVNGVLFVAGGQNGSRLLRTTLAISK